MALWLVDYERGSVQQQLALVRYFRMLTSNGTLLALECARNTLGTEVLLTGSMVIIVQLCNSCQRVTKLFLIAR